METGKETHFNQPQYLQSVPIYGDDTDEVNIVEYWYALKKYYWIPVMFAVVAMIVSTYTSLRKPNIYRADALIMPVNAKPVSARSRLLEQFGGLAGFAGISLGSTGASNENTNLAILKTRVFITMVIEKNNLLPVLFPDEWDAKSNKWIDDSGKGDSGFMAMVKGLKNGLKNTAIGLVKYLFGPKESPKNNVPSGGGKKNHPDIDDGIKFIKDAINFKKNVKSGMITITADSENPKQAADLLMLFINTLNRYLKAEAIKETRANMSFLEVQLQKTPLIEMRKTLFSIIEEQTRQIMLAETREDFAFKIIDPATVPNIKFKPNRSKTIIVSTFVAGIIGIFFIVFLKVVNDFKEKARPTSMEAEGETKNSATS